MTLAVECILNSDLKAGHSADPDLHREEHSAEGDQRPVAQVTSRVRGDVVLVIKRECGQ